MVVKFIDIWLFLKVIYLKHVTYFWKRAYTEILVTWNKEGKT